MYIFLHIFIIYIYVFLHIYKYIYIGYWSSSGMTWDEIKLNYEIVIFISLFMTAISIGAIGGNLILI